MAGYGQFCPIAQAAEVLTERWTPLVVRELLYGSRRFNEIRRGVPLTSSSMLSKRLRSLERTAGSGLVRGRLEATCVAAISGNRESGTGASRRFDSVT